MEGTSLLPPFFAERTEATPAGQKETVLPAGSPGEAIRLAKEYAGEIHLLLTDVVMPEMNGLDLAKELRVICPTIKCLFMSGYTADVIAHHGVLAKGVHFLHKPFSKQELGDMVRSVRKNSAPESYDESSAP